jgi:HEXXH motif-containing protein
VAPTEVDRIFAHPYVGAWLAYTRRLVHKQITSEWPLWTHIGHLHALAVAAAIRADIAFEAKVPLRHGEVILPTLGMARPPADSPWSIADVRGGADGVRVSRLRALS